MKHRKYDKITLWCADGEWRDYNLPRFFTVSDVLKKRCHSEAVCLWIPKGHFILGSGNFDGPCWALWHDGDFIAKFADHPRNHEAEILQCLSNSRNAASDCLA